MSFNKFNAVEGADDLDRWFQTVLPRLAKKVLRKASRQGAKLVADTARQMAPVDEGRLEQSIKVRAVPRSRKRVGHQIMGGESKRSMTAGLPFYASFVELGTKKMKADPFLRPALWTNIEKIRSLFAKWLRAFIRQEKMKR